jgi:hypothetical protein
MYVTVTTTDGAEGIRPEFDAALLAGAYMGRAARGGAEQLTGLTILTPDSPGCSPWPGQRSCLADRTALGGPTEDPPPWKTSESVIEREIIARLARAGLKADSIRFEYPTRYPVPIVALRTNDAAAFLKRFPSRGELVFGFDPRYEGHYLEVIDAEGRLVLAEAGAYFRGMGGANPELLK